jgi:Glycosyl hydrolase family 99
MGSRLISMCLSFAILGALLFPGSSAVPSAQADAERLVLAFYYPWYDQNTWNSGKVPDLPQALYNSDDRSVMARQIEQAQAAGIDGFVLNWWGKGNRTEKNLKALLDVAAEKGFRMAVDFDFKNSPVMGGVASYAENLRHLYTVHAAHPAYLRVGGRPVIFFYNVSALPVATWQHLRDQVDPDRNALWIAEGTSTQYLSVFDGHHLYSITWPNRIPPSQTLSSWGDRVRKYNRENGTAKLWIATVMPGYDDRKARPGNGFARSRDGGEYYRQSWQAAIASKPQWVVINSFNEWVEGSYIEPSRAYGGLYLDLTREWAARFKGADFKEADLSASPASPPPAPTRDPSTPEAPALSVATASTAMPPAPTLGPSGPSYVIQVPQRPNESSPGSECSYVPFERGGLRIWTVTCPVSGRAQAPPVLLR